MDFLIKVVLYIIAIFFGGSFIGGGIANYKDGKYGACGLNIMFALSMIRLMFSI